MPLSCPQEQGVGVEEVCQGALVPPSQEVAVP